MIFCLSPSRYYQARPEGSSILRRMFGGSKGLSCSTHPKPRPAVGYLSVAQRGRRGLPLLPKPQVPSLKPQEPRAPGERQPPFLALYSRRMKKPATYRSKLSSRVPTGSVGTISFCTVTPSAHRRTKHHLNSASSGNTPKKTNSVGVLLNFAPVPASPSAPGGSLSFPCQLPGSP